MFNMGAILERPRWSLARQRANELAEHYSSPPIPVKEIAENNGVDVVFARFRDWDDVIAGFCDFESAKLFVNAGDHINRQRFTIAHELGHWILHREHYLAHPEQYPVLPRYERPDNTNPFEKEANFFAAHLLVPQRLLAHIKDAPVTMLAEAFLVSREMMEHRLKNA